MITNEDFQRRVAEAIDQIVEIERAIDDLQYYNISLAATETRNALSLLRQAKNKLLTAKRLGRQFASIIGTEE